MHRSFYFLLFFYTNAGNFVCIKYNEIYVVLYFCFVSNFFTYFITQGDFYYPLQQDLPEPDSAESAEQCHEIHTERRHHHCPYYSETVL